jgi:hypothetical protein
MPRVAGFLRVLGGRGGHHPDQGLPGVDDVDPGFGVDGPGSPDQGLPPMGGLHPDQGLPANPPGIWPPLTPSHPIQPAPGVPPGTIWPPVGGPVHPDQGLPAGGGGGTAGQLPAGGRPVGPNQGLPSKTFWVVAGIPGVGWRYICVDPSLKPDQGGPAPSPQPKS